MKVSIVIPTMTKELVNKCIGSIVKYTDLDDVEIVVVYNGGDFTNYLTERWAFVKALQFYEPLGAVKAFNEGIKAASGDYILLMNDDCEILPSEKNYWLDELLKPFSDPQMAVTGCYKMTPQMGMNDLHMSKDRMDYGFILFFCALIPRKIFDEVGLLDEAMECGVDVDFCMKCKDKGYKIAQVPDEELNSNDKLALGNFPFYHQGEGTVHDFYGDRWAEILKKDAAILNERYGVREEDLVKVSRPEVSITITAYGDRLDEITKCIDSIYSHTELTGVEIVVVANAVSERVNKYLRSRLVRYVWHEKALGAAGAINESLKMARGVYKIVLNQDVVILGKEWLPMLLEPFKDLQVGMTGALMRPIAGMDVSFLHGFCVALRDEVFAKVGPWDEGFIKGGFEDLDYSVRVQDAGYKIVQVPAGIAAPEFGHKYGFEGAFPIFHVENHGTWLDKETENINRKRFFEKHKKHLINAPRGIINIDWYVVQKKYELTMLQEFLKNYPMKKVVEIGTFRGGTALLWAHMIKPDGKVFCADMHFTYMGAFMGYSFGVPGGKEYKRQVYDDTEYKKFITEFQGDTHSPEFVQNLQSIVGGDADFMFIDGDHSYEGVKQDFENYKSVVKDGGYIAFHDIIDSEHHRSLGCEVSRLWNEIKHKYNSWEFVDNNEYGGAPCNSMGIGVIQMSKTAQGWTPDNSGDKPESSEDNRGVVPVKQALPKLRVFDCFMLFNELDMLEARLEILDKVVDIFVISESAYTHSGKSKPLYFKENYKRFQKWEHKIRYIIVDGSFDIPSATGEPWENERRQRDRLKEGLFDVNDNDVIIISDIDEIPNPGVVQEYVLSDKDFLYALEMNMYYYTTEWKAPYKWLKAKIMRWSTAKEYSLSTFRQADMDGLLHNGGWHLSYFGGVTQIADKLDSFAHQEYNTAHMKSPYRVTKCIVEGLDIVDRGKEYNLIKVVPTKEGMHPVLIKKFSTKGNENMEEIKKSNDVPCYRGLMGEILDKIDAPLIKVTAYMSTKDRYNTTLPLAIVAVASQTHKPDELVIIDDGEQKDLREEPVYKSLFQMLDELKIKWKFIFGQKKGQVLNHQMMLNIAENKFIWRVDDDNYPEADVLSILLQKIISDDKIGAVASRCIVPNEVVKFKETSGKIADLGTHANVQWSESFAGYQEVDHLHNSFLYRKEAGLQVGYHMGLSPVGHREETMFTYGMKLKGWKLFVCGEATTWHFRQKEGGIRSFKNQAMWDSDEQVFQTWLRLQNQNEDEFIAVLDNGLGDHLDFFTLLPEIRAKFPDKKIVLATCFPEVFEGEDLKQISIAEAIARFGNIDSYNVYNFMGRNKWSRGIKEAYRELYFK